MNRPLVLTGIGLTLGAERGDPKVPAAFRATRRPPTSAWTVELKVQMKTLVGIAIGSRLLGHSKLDAIQHHELTRQADSLFVRSSRGNWSSSSRKAT